MKKRNLFALGILGAMTVLTTACSDDDDRAPIGPRLDVTEVNTASTSGAITISEGESLSFEWDARSGETKLQTFSMSINGANAVSPLPQTNEGYDLPYAISNSQNSLFVDGIAFENAGTNVGTTEYRFTVTDGIGLTATRLFTVNVTSLTTDLSAPQNFTWNRVAGAEGTGLSQFGLKWTNNSSTNAIVAINGATTMHSLPASAWTEVDTQEALMAAIANANGISQYTNVSVGQGATYNDVLGVVHNGTAYLINVQLATVNTAAAGTTVTISGQYKH